MPALNPPRPHTETLANGLRVTLRHVPALKRCAAALRVAAGSHDVPLAWPGLAHFLEHLLFLGTERFPASEELMAYVQRHGGQVNAQTSERTTDFFFELPPQAFDGGLERLSDMLAHPRMNPDDQLREREVLHAEFIAWSQDAAAQQQMACSMGFARHIRFGVFMPATVTACRCRARISAGVAGFSSAVLSDRADDLEPGRPASVDELRVMAEAFAAPLPR